MWGLLGGLFSSCLPPQYRQRRPSRIRRRYLVGLIDQLAQFGRRVVAGDAVVLVAQRRTKSFIRCIGWRAWFSPCFSRWHSLMDESSNLLKVPATHIEPGEQGREVAQAAGDDVANAAGGF